MNPDAWLDVDPRVFSARVLVAHAAGPPAGSCAWHQWHYAASPALLARVNAWHAAGQVLHLEYVDQVFDTAHAPRGALEAQHHAEVRLRQLWGHSGRKVQQHEARGHWRLRWTEDDGRVCLERHTREILEQLADWGIPAERTPPVNPLSYLKVCVRAVTVDRYALAGVAEGNPRWWVDVRSTRVYSDDDPRPRRTVAARLTVECDPVTRKWDSDDEEVVDHHDHGNNEAAPPELLPAVGTEPALVVTTHPVARVRTCQACVPARLPEKQGEEPEGVDY